ncbi:lytic transglycosylase domain-containing protein [Acuticoccus sp. MNP-M23]|uniref:lytic transglycosylase domain-containing protein n=1 Tax=Acuticoccus sp. MNP-M23 TaxID=3072793 RepID=UPI00281652C2|nr:lytic transglycosylase domain-containing protein [Acuticoccus sp. MNP-M23]WMS43756.1 lytic transglycosylase domain-containing protein [Acuticoccus sp. MNP-M23]
MPPFHLCRINATASGSICRALTAAVLLAASAAVSPLAAQDDVAPPHAAGAPEVPATEAATKPPEPKTMSPAEKKAKETAELCTLLSAAADAHGVPHEFFIRLIWKESRFNAGAVSPVGAQGIAQFMPGTARLRGLKNPFDREEALFASASFLADLKAELGSWGLAAAGYNGGPNRIPRFVAGEGSLPYETIDYVYSITGRTAKHWAIRANGLPDRPPVVTAWRRSGDLAAPAPAKPDAVLTETAGPPAPSVPERAGPPVQAVEVALAYPPPARPEYRPQAVDCPDLIARLGRARDVRPPTGGGWTPWGAQVAGHPKRSIAMRQYARLKSRLPGDLVAKGPSVVVRRFAARGRLPIHAVQFAAPSRGEAQALCRRIARALAPCVVVKNS